MDTNSDLSADEQWIIRQLTIIRSQERQLGSALANPNAGSAEKIRARLEKLNSRIELLERVLDPPPSYFRRPAMPMQHGASNRIHEVAQS